MALPVQALFGLVRILGIKGTLAVAALVLSTPAVTMAKQGVGIIASTRYESHTMSGSKTADNALTTSFTFVRSLDNANSFVASIGQRFDIEDNESDGMAMSLAYIRNFSKSSYAMAGYSNYRIPESIDDGRLADTGDMLTFMHGWNIVKRDALKASLSTAFTTDTAFDNNRMFSEALNFGGPLAKDFRWNVGYQFGYSLVDHRHSVDVLDFKFSRRLTRRAQVSLGYRQVKYLSAVGRDVDDNQWILGYNFRIR